MLFDDDEYAEVLDLVRGHSVGLAKNRYGNPGDTLIHRATMELFRRHGVSCRTVCEDELSPERMPSGVSLLVESGGGNVGARFKSSGGRRRRMAEVPGPKIILPQSAFDSAEDLSAFDTVFARERVSYAMLKAVHPDVRLAPDMALSLRLPSAVPGEGEGLFLRDDEERTEAGGIDPARAVRDETEYLALAGRYRRVVTNRLHFAIAALLQGCAAVLKPNCYHKNRAMFETWLCRCPNAEWGDR